MTFTHSTAITRVFLSDYEQCRRKLNNPHRMRIWLIEKGCDPDPSKYNVVRDENMHGVFLEKKDSHNGE